MPHAKTVSARQHAPEGLQRSLTSTQLSMIAIGGAIGTGLFLGSGFAIGLAGPSVLLSYLLAGFISLLLMGCLTEMTVAHPTPGSFGAYAGHYIGPLAGFLVRYSYWSAVVLAVGTEVTAIAVYMRLWFPSTPGWLWIALFSTLLIGINALRVGVFGSLESFFSLVKIVAILGFILLALFVLFSRHRSPALGFHLYTDHGGFFPFGLRGTWFAVIVAIFSYFSIEMIAVAAGEARNPGESVTRAFRATLGRLVGFYLVTLALMLAIVPWQQAGTSGSPFVRVMQAVHLPYAAACFNLVVLVAAVSAMNSQLYITSRTLFSLARAGYAPAALGRLTRAGVPLHALLLSSSGVLVAVVANALFPGVAFIFMMAISIFGALFTWLMIFVTFLFYRRSGIGRPEAFRMTGAPWTALLGAGLLLAILLTTPFTREFRATLLYGIPFLLLLTAFFFKLRSGPGANPDATLPPLLDS